MSAEEFILIPRSVFIQERPIVEQVLHNPHVGSKGKQLTLLQRYDTPKFESVPEPEYVPSLKERVFDSFVTFTDAQKKKSNFIYDRLEGSYRLSLDNEGIILIDNAPTGLSINTFLHALHQPKKRLEKLYQIILPQLGIQSHLVANKGAKTILEDVWIEFKTPDGKTPTKENTTPKK
jgi:hypothetical protein